MHSSLPAIVCIGKLFGVGLIVSDERLRCKAPEIAAPNAAVDWHAYCALPDDSRAGGVYGINNGAASSGCHWMCRLCFLVTPEARRRRTHCWHLYIMRIEKTMTR